MKFPLQVTSRNVELSVAEQALIRDAAAKLASFARRIISCRVLVEVPNRRQRAGFRYNVRITLQVPSGAVVIRRQPQPSLQMAVQQAFDAAGRRLQDAVRRRRGDVKSRRNGSRSQGVSAAVGVVAPGRTT